MDFDEPISNEKKIKNCQKNSFSPTSDTCVQNFSRTANIKKPDPNQKTDPEKMAGKGKASSSKSSKKSGSSNAGRMVNNINKNPSVKLPKVPKKDSKKFEIPDDKVLIISDTVTFAGMVNEDYVKIVELTGCAPICSKIQNGGAPNEAELPNGDNRVKYCLIDFTTLGMFRTAMQAAAQENPPQDASLRSNPFYVDLKTNVDMIDTYIGFVKRKYVATLEGIFMVIDKDSDELTKSVLGQGVSIQRESIDNDHLRQPSDHKEKLNRLRPPD